MKVWNYFFLAIGLEMLFTMAGLFEGATTVSGGLMQMIGFTITDGVMALNFSGSNFFALILGPGTNALKLVTAAGIGTIAVGFFTRSKPENYLTLGILIPTFLVISATFMNILNVIMTDGGTSPIGAIALLIMAPIGIMFAVSALEFFRGTD